jgi:hypothetical protein
VNTISGTLTPVSVANGAIEAGGRINVGSYPVAVAIAP